MHKFFKTIQFLILILLQLSFANSFASICVDKDNAVSRIEFSVAAKSNPEFSKTDFKENHIFEPYFYDVVSCPSISFCASYAELIESWKLLDEVGEIGLGTRLDDIEYINNYITASSKTTSQVKAEINAASYKSWKLVNGAGRHANWVEILDVRNKINVKVGHVIENLDINTAGTKFTGCHSEISLQNHIASNPTSRYEFRNVAYDANSGIDDASRVFEAKPVVIKADGSEMIKGNNQGVSSFFPQNWNKNKILDEVENAVTNNHGRDLTSTNPNEYFGFSKDGKVEIHFYYNVDGSIGSYFPKKR